MNLNTRNAIGTILVQVKVKQLGKPCMTLIARYYSVEEALNIAQHVFPEALNISCINLGAKNETYH